jgi:hypothetical protein
MRNTFKISILAASLIAASALTFSGACAEPMNGGVMRSTIQVDDGRGGWKPYVPNKPPAGPTGVSVGDGQGGWKPYFPPARPGPGISIDDGAGGWIPYVPRVKLPKAPRPIRHVTDKRSGWTYYLAQDRNTGEKFVQIVDANGADVHIDGEVPMPGGGPIYPVR